MEEETLKLRPDSRNLLWGRGGRQQRWKVSQAEKIKHTRVLSTERGIFEQQRPL